MKISHNIPPLYSENSKILILGSFPSVKSRETEFFYGHPQNRFWKVLSSVFSSPEPKTVEEKKKLILSNSLALWDVISDCEITGSSDSSIKDVIPNDLTEILSQSKIEKIYLNGKTAEKYYIKYTEPKTKIKGVCLPSTSPANAGYSLRELISSWSVLAK